VSINQYPEWIKCNELNALQSREIIALKERIKRLEDRIRRASIAFFRDGSDGQVASGMLAILEEERNKP
jgi:transcription elongation GreA/GreB family factor